MPRVTAPARVQEIPYKKQGGPEQARNNRVIAIKESCSGTQRTMISMFDQVYSNFTTPIELWETEETPLYSRVLENDVEDVEGSDWRSNCATVVGDDKLSQHSFSSSTTVVESTEWIDFRLNPKLLFQGSFHKLHPHLFRPDISFITCMAISTNDSSSFQSQNIILRGLNSLHLQTRHPEDLIRFQMPNIKSLALLAVDIRDTSFMGKVTKVMNEAKEWRTKPSKLFLGLRLSFNQWRLLLGILGEHATSLQIAVPGSFSEDHKLDSFLDAKDELGKNERTEILPFAKDIRFHDTGNISYSELVLQSAQETLGIHTRG